MNVILVLWDRIQDEKATRKGISVHLSEEDALAFVRMNEYVNAAGYSRLNSFDVAKHFYRAAIKQEVLIEAVCKFRSVRLPQLKQTRHALALNGIYATEKISNINDQNNIHG